jgi:aconitase A
VIVSVLSDIRNRILDLALELERIHPDVACPAKPADRAQLIQVANAVNYGNAAIGSALNLPVHISFELA